MTPDVVRRMLVPHAIVAWLGALLLLAIAALLVRGRSQDKPWFRALSISASSCAAVSFVSGLLLETHYRIHLKQRLFLASRSLGWLFERKMHLSFGVFLFASIGLLTLLLTRNDPRFFRSARAAYVFAAFFALSACVISSIVGVYEPFVE
ncbi:MAG: hypothetical protein IPM54_21015 [Polyangiaceae bacterium]|nr:hypothetical protein [Polyangiaceae bacterium]